MTSSQNRKPKAGESVVLTKASPELLSGLPEKDQNAIREIVGKPILLAGYDEAGRAELEFTDGQGVIHFVYVNPDVIVPAQ